MKMAAKPRPKPPATFEQQYRAALLDYTENPSEAALGRAYKLGRNAIAAGQSLLEIASLHHQALQEIVSAARESQPHNDLLKAGADFLAESLSPYEMAHRGFQDAVKALRRLNETLEEETKRIAHAVHDEAGQLLVAVHIALAELASDLPKSQHRQLGRIDELLNQAEAQLRRFSHELRPTILDDLGWLAAIRFLADNVSKRTGIPIQIHTKISGRLSGSLETALYRIVQEALTNAMKHAKPTRVRIDVLKENHTLCCSIQDDGVGFDVRLVKSSGKREGLGLIGIQERLNALGGILSIDSVRGRGTTLLFRLPMEVPHAHSHRAR
jgi:two-component system sensor histidine kinase UhpB